MHTQLVTIALSHEGINRLLGIPLFELYNINISLDCLYGNELNLLSEQLELEYNDIGLIHCLDAFFIQKLRLCKTADRKAVYKVMKILNESTSPTSVKELASRMSMHVRTLERLFSKNVGLPPKELLRIRRFILLKDHVIGNPQIHWTDLLIQCGFYDQAHMNHEISKVTDMTPYEFFRMVRTLSS
jgi:AraC-like DNA-binding protein